MKILAPTTEDLLHRMATADDPQAFALFFTRFHSPLLGFAMRYVRGRELAEEVVSDVFLKVWHKRASLPTIQNISSYLYVAVKNQALNYLQKAENHPTQELEEVPAALQVEDMTPERTLLTQELYHEIQRAVQKLPPQCQTIFRLIREDGLKYREVADILELSVKTVEVQMGIAIKKISAELQHHLPQGRPGAGGGQRLAVWLGPLLPLAYWQLLARMLPARRPYFLRPA
ncbi:RNA polymerase sigma-70 factor [Hymenobacter metallilatus]|uniref:RNA polymerase sigma-70 factor n=1 Tax=Hymenobacter metallilatus TaxID=2493666 RepID=A0A428JUH8_9BACT|nr:RNA polymerase sigma-70 factor [Hymenobacter metallilatus]RSK37684.1 RNA polymerase sigma-70 factor [Hymenobacter metallilatus]